MNKRNIASFIGCVALVTLSTQLASAQFGSLFGGSNLETISVSELDALLTEQRQAEANAKEEGVEPPKADFVLVDVRSDAETKVSVIPGAITKAQYEKNREQYQGRTVIPYCTVGGRSAAYAKQLQAKRVQVKNFKGSILAWVRAGLPVVQPDGKPTNRVHTNSDRHRIPAKYEQVTE